MMWPGPGSCHSRRLRFQWTTCQPPVPRPSSTAVVLTTTSSPTATGPGQAGEDDRPAPVVQGDALQSGPLGEHGRDGGGDEAGHRAGRAPLRAS